MRILSLALVIVCSVSAWAQQETFANATPKYAPDRTFDLLHVKVQIDVDAKKRSYQGISTNTLSPLRDGAPIVFHAGANLAIDRVSVDAKPVKFRREGEMIIVESSAKRGQKVVVSTAFRVVSDPEGGLMAYGGWHWVEPTAEQPNRVGFWTQGETELNRQWAPTWDYPNDMATSETITRVPADWMVVSNGDLVANTVSGGIRTVHWRMSQPHVTYLISLVGGPFDIEKAAWRKKELWYVVPRGKKHLIEDSFSDTKDMLDFFSRVTGVEYAWSKYAQNAVYEFGGGMENVSSTTLGEDSLTDRREGFRNMSSLNSHELAHQWFGDFVTCKDWGHIWLNESFATYFQMAYFEHARGANAYTRELVNATQSYLDEAKRYQRPIATNRYPDGDAMFDSHAYPKGGMVLHTLRRHLGDAAFYEGIKHYLTKHRHEPVETSQFCRAMSESSGINLEPFFDQWVYKPGHPVIDYAWKQEGGQVVLTIQQLQDTSKGTPLYDIKTEALVIAKGKLTRFPVHLKDKETTVRMPVASADAVVLDPDRDFLSEMRRNAEDKELPAIAEFAPDAFVRSSAIQRMVVSNQPGAIELAVRLLDKDMGLHPVVESLQFMVGKKDEVLKGFFRRQLAHPSIERRASAVRGLAAIGLSAEDAAKIRSLINDTEGYSVVTSAISTLDPERDLDVLIKAAGMPSKDARIANAALGILVRSKSDRVAAVVLRTADSQDYETRLAGLRRLGSLPVGPEGQRRLTAALKSQDAGVLEAAVSSIETNKDKAMLAAVRAVKVPERAGWLKDRVNNLVKALGG